MPAVQSVRCRGFVNCMLGSARLLSDRKPRNIRFCFRCPQDLPRGTQEAPRCRQDAPQFWYMFLLINCWSFWVKTCLTIDTTQKCQTCLAPPPPSILPPLLSLSNLLCSLLIEPVFVSKLFFIEHVFVRLFFCCLHWPHLFFRGAVFSMFCSFFFVCAMCYAVFVFFHG